MGPQMQTPKYHSCERSTNLTNCLSPQICGFAICRTYLRTAHLCSIPLDIRNTSVLLLHNLVWTASLLLRVFTIYQLKRTTHCKNKMPKIWKNIPRKGISGPQSQFPHSRVCDRIIYSQDGSAFSAQAADPLPPFATCSEDRHHLNEDFTSLLPTGIGERF